MDAREHIRHLIRDISDFPKKGILFKDITPLLQDPKGMKLAVDLMGEPFEGAGVDVVLGIESRGYLFAAPLAYKLGAGLVLVRKPGKLPYKTLSAEYELEYGKDTIEIHEDAIKPGQRVLLVDDLIATGGTAAAALELVKKAGGEVVALTFLIELGVLAGREKLSPHPINVVLHYT
ncbi:MAG: adenine phosphoribosyltransferase [Deltaproteobacteria bacterium RBG_13_65_10]|nr:MAG: adenine phosphoribosyltransferase [Deltaproteobacteria bacterium RBG_13_65_10]